MRKLIYIIIVVAVASVGFYIGRATGFKDIVIEPAQLTSETEHPLPPPPPESEPYVPGIATEEPTKPLLLESPVEDAEISGAFTVAGRAKSDSNRLLVSLLDAGGEELFSRKIDLEAENGDSYARFSISIGDLGYVGDATLRIVYFGSEGGTESRHISLISPDLVELQIFMTNTNLNLWQQCDKVFPVRRQISSNSNIYRAIIEALFAGPTENETANGYGTELPKGVKLKSVGADAEGTVTADFDGKLERGVAGSCRVTAIRAQIEATLKQFPEVHSVVISVEGQKEGILQP
ncbi:MAG: GerMN domain-containing protein [Patescibacteria group bacterium]